MHLLLSTKFGGFMDWVNVTGSVNSFLVFASVYGIWLQLRTIWRRREKSKSFISDELPTEVLSANQFFVSFLAYYSFFCFGLALTPINHFLIWPRIVACILVMLIIVEIAKDRQSRATQFCQHLVLIMLLCAAAMLLTSWSSITISIDIGDIQGLASLQVVVVTLILAQGYFRQIYKIIVTGRTGAIDIRMSQFLLLMDISTLAFGFSLGINNGWPLLFLATTSAITKLIIMYLFVWVRVSPYALLKRSQH